MPTEARDVILRLKLSSINFIIGIISEYHYKSTTILWINILKVKCLLKIPENIVGKRLKSLKSNKLNQKQTNNSANTPLF